MFYFAKGRLISLALLSLSALLLWQNYYWFMLTNQFQDKQVQVLYSKENNLQKELLKVIYEADHFIYFSIYTFTSEEIASGLIAAKLRGLEVRGILDRRQTDLAQEKPILRKLRNYGIPMLVPDKSEGIMHTKFLVTEKAYASGSYNWTFSANNTNDEVLETGKVEGIRKSYQEIFEQIYSRYQPGCLTCT
jgi:phosphatidylserine/phosphatidylglycerophosphate/cardiolipin synthase-like enzyme